MTKRNFFNTAIIFRGSISLGLDIKALQIPHNDKENGLEKLSYPLVKKRGQCTVWPSEDSHVSWNLKPQEHS